MITRSHRQRYVIELYVNTRLIDFINQSAANGDC